MATLHLVGAGIIATATAYNAAMNACDRSHWCWSTELVSSMRLAGAASECLCTDQLPRYQEPSYLVVSSLALFRKLQIDTFESQGSQDPH